MKAIGIDWGHRELCVAVVGDDRSRPTCTYLSAHDMPALLALIEQQARGGPILIAIEAGKRLIAESLRVHGFEVTEVAPERADIARKAYFPGGAKDDRRDAKALALAVLEAPRLLGRLVPFPPRRRQLRQLSQARTRAVHCRVRAIQQLIDITRNGHPGLDALGLDFTTDYALALAAAYPHPLRAHRARRSKIARLIQRAKSLDAEHVLACFADRGHVIDALVADAVAEEISMTVERIQLMTRHIRRYDKLIAKAFADHPDAEIFASIPGMGPTLAPRIAARLDRDSVQQLSCGQAQTLAGTAPRTVSSGGRHRGVVMRRIACDHELHQALIAMARASLATSEWAHAFVRHRAGGPKNERHSYFTAIRALANKWIKILHALLVRRQTYDESVHIKHLQDAAVPWAAGIAPAA